MLRLHYENEVDDLIDGIWTDSDISVEDLVDIFMDLSRRFDAAAEALQNVMDGD